MVYDATGRIVPVGGIPIDAGCVIQNVSTLKNIALAQKDIPVTHKRLTITGEVATPITIDAPLGMSFRECIQLAGGPANEEGYGLICGGPMMGPAQMNWDGVVTKTTGGLIVIPKDHPHFLRKTKPIEFNKKLAKQMCCQCMTCTSMCPRNALGLGVKPHLAMTGELSLKGSVLPIGGLREKTVAAKRNKIKTILIPKANERDLEEIPEHVKKGIKFIPVTNADEVMNLVF